MGKVRRDSGGGSWRRSGTKRTPIELKTPERKRGERSTSWFALTGKWWRRVRVLRWELEAHKLQKR